MKNITHLYKRTRNVASLFLNSESPEQRYIILTIIIIIHSSELLKKYFSSHDFKACEFKYSVLFFRF